MVAVGDAGDFGAGPRPGQTSVANANAKNATFWLKCHDR